MKRKRIIGLTGLLLVSFLVAACSKTKDNFEDSEFLSSESEVDKSLDKENENSGATIVADTYLLPGEYRLNSNGGTKAYIKFYEDGTCTRFDGTDDSKLVPGTYTVKGDIVCVKDDKREVYSDEGFLLVTFNNTNVFKIAENGMLVFLPEESDNFTYITLTSESVFAFTKAATRNTATISGMYDMLDMDLPDELIVGNIDYAFEAEPGSYIYGPIPEDYDTTNNFIFAGISVDEYLLAKEDGQDYCEVGGIGYITENSYYITPEYKDGLLDNVVFWLDQTGLVTYKDEYVDNDEFTIILRDYEFLDNVDNTEFDYENLNYYRQYYGRFYYAFFTNYEKDSPQMYFMYLDKYIYSKDEFRNILKTVKDI